MSRDIDAALKAASKQDKIQPVILVKLKYDSADVNVWSGFGTLSFGGEDYLGVGDFGSVSPVQEDSELATSSIQLTLSGINPALLSVQLNEHYQGNPATVWLGMFDNTTQALLTPTIIFKGLMDNSQITLGKTGIITVNVTNRLARWDKTNDRRYNNNDQKNLFPDDDFFQFVEGLSEKVLVWGRESNDTNK
jgi:hypothetical protein